MSEKKGELILVDSIYPNRLNPNEMAVDDFIQLKNDIRDDNYDPIIISPLDVFYNTPESRNDPRVTAVIPHDADPAETYVIPDGFHRHKAASELGLTHIRALIRHQTELDAMPYFWRRHKLRGEMNPIKEAELFRHMMDVQGLGWGRIVEIFNLSGVNYIKTRLALLNVTTDVVELFYKPPEGLPGKLSTEHLRAISFLPKNMQYAVAMMSLERNWRVEDIRTEVKRIREGKGLRASDGEPLEGPPGSYPTIMQRYLHPNIDRLLRPHEEKVVRAVKKLGEARNIELAEFIGVSVPALYKTLNALCAMDVLDFRKEQKGIGHPTKFYRLWVAKEQPKSEYLRDVPLTDAEILKMYPPRAKDSTTKKVTTVKEKLGQEKKQAPIRVGHEREVPIGPDEWTKGEKPSPPPERPRERGPLRVPPMVLNQELIEDFMEMVYNEAISEGLDIKTKRPIDGQEPGVWLEKEIRDNLRDWAALRAAGKRDYRNLVMIGVRVCQLFHRYREIS